MIIPVRVPATAPIHTAGGSRELDPDLPLYHQHCPVCDFYLGMKPITLVLVGIHPDDRKESGWTTGAAVAVHAECVGDTADGGEQQ